ncbi:MAG: transporter, partial [Dehalococcoidia bacterium]|nr:transporter [Dehalococcoidia bacterium]
MFHLKHYRSTAPGFADLLNYATLIDSGVVLGKDGALLAGFLYDGYDAQTLSSAERETISARFNAALARLGGGCATWTEAVRLPAPGYSDRALSRFPDLVTAAIDEERRERFSAAGASFETQHALFIQYLPPRVESARLSKLMVVGQGGETVSYLDQHLTKFARILAEFEDSFSGAVRALRRMETFRVGDPDRGPIVHQDELVNVLQTFLTGDHEACVNLPPVPMYMDGWIAGVDLYPGSPPRLGDNYIRSVSLEGFPGASYPGILDALDELAVPYRWS